jgi:hypothetical protein
LLRILGVGADILLISPKGDQFKYVLQLHFKASNNTAEYESLLYNMCMALARRRKWMPAYNYEVSKMDVFELSHVGRVYNKAASALAKGSGSTQCLPRTLHGTHHQAGATHPQDPKSIGAHSANIN